jgi:hypothetical protein
VNFVRLEKYIKNTVCIKNSVAIKLTKIKSIIFLKFKSLHKYKHIKQNNGEEYIFSTKENSILYLLILKLNLKIL